MSKNTQAAVQAEQEQLNTQKPTAEQGQSKKPAQGKGNTLIWIALSILIVLLIISTVLLCVRLVEYAKVDDRVVSLSSNMNETLDVFSVEYENSSGDITIKGAEGEKVLAPGAQVEYTVRIRNTDKVAIDFHLQPRVSFLSNIELPIVVRLIGPDEQYIAGSATEWVPMEQLNEIDFVQTLVAGEYVEYYFQWKWPFESGNDDYDTWLGDSVGNAAVGADLTFSIHASANTDAALNGGPFGYQTPNIVYIIIFIILLVAAITLLIIRLARKMVELPPETVPVPVPVQVMKNFTFDTFMTDHMNVIRIEEFIDSYAAGDVVNLETLQQKGLMNPRATTLKVLARANCELKVPLTVEAHSISAEAKRAILKAGGEVRIVKK